MPYSICDLPVSMIICGVGSGGHIVRADGVPVNTGITYLAKYIRNDCDRLAQNPIIAISLC